MPGNSKSQLNGFVADRRYWDRKHPEHDDHLAFTVKAFEETYPDPPVPTKEQAEWAAQEEKRLREMARLRPYWDKRDPAHAQAVADVRRGFDKINAVLYSTPEPEPAETPTPATRDPLDPVMPAPDGFARAMSVTQSAQAGRAPAEAPQAPRPSTQPNDRMVQSAGDTQQALSPFWQIPERQPQRPPRPAAEFVLPPPRVIHPDINAPEGHDPDLHFSPLMVSPRQIERLWELLDDPDSAMRNFSEAWKGERIQDPRTRQFRPPTDREIRELFERSQNEIKRFLWQYHEKKDSVLPEDGERIYPFRPPRSPDSFNPDDRLG